MSEINHSIEKSIDTFEKISNILYEKNVGGSDRRTLLMAYFDICMEHIQSIHVLVKAKLYGSAFALVRPFYETYYRALWMLKIATNDEVEKIMKGKFNFLNMGTKIKELDSIYTGTDFFDNLKSDSWGAMNDYTHSGILQLSRRWTNDELAPNYEESEIVEVLNATRMVLLLFTFVVLKEHKYNDEAEKVNTLIVNRQG